MISFCSCDLNYAADVIKLNRYDICIYYICNDKLLLAPNYWMHVDKVIKDKCYLS